MCSLHAHTHAHFDLDLDLDCLTRARVSHRTHATMPADDGNLWQHILRESSVRTKLPTATLLVAGDPESGKTALLARLDDATKHSSQPLQQTADTLLAYSTINVLDPKAKDSGGDVSGASHALSTCT